MPEGLHIVWFRQDLRLKDNPALFEAAKQGRVLAIYIFDDCAPKAHRLGQASAVWLHHSLRSLSESLGDKLHYYCGDAQSIFKTLLSAHRVAGVHWSTAYEPWHLKQAQAVQALCQDNDVPSHEYASNYLWAPDAVLKDDGSYYKVFTAYKKRARHVPVREPLPAPSPLTLATDKNGVSLTTLSLLPTISWHQQMMEYWETGEQSAHKKLKAFIRHDLADYKAGRDFPAKEKTSLLSPHLHFGEISPFQVWHAAQAMGPDYASDANLEHFLSEVVWREFSCYLMVHFPRLHHDNFNPKFDAFPWRSQTKLLHAWQQGRTGYPLVDAGMRELWQTGTMHNRVRMVVASFLVKNLLIHWHYGRDWFWDCLLDADLANNSASWQWVAGSGADAAPYFRVFNPVTQGEKFDPTGEYTRRFVPELTSLPDKYLYQPWEAPDAILRQAKIVLGKDYPAPIIALKASREEALAAYAVIKG